MNALCLKLFVNRRASRNNSIVQENTPRLVVHDWQDIPAGDLHFLKDQKRKQKVFGEHQGELCALNISDII